MSRFIANTISFDKNLENFRVKGGSNNVHPRPNEWLSWDNVKNLYFYVNSGSIDIQDKKESAVAINDLIYSFEFKTIKPLYEDEFSAELSYYNVFNFFHSYNEDKFISNDEVVERIRGNMKEMDEKEIFSKEYREKRKNILKYFIDNIEIIRKDFDKFNNEFIKALKERIDEVKKDKRKFILKNTRTNSYVSKLVKNGCYTSYSQENAKKLRYYQAKQVAERFSLEMIEIK